MPLWCSGLAEAVPVVVVVFLHSSVEGCDSGVWWCGGRLGISPSDVMVVCGQACVT